MSTVYACIMSTVYACIMSTVYACIMSTVYACIMSTVYASKPASTDLFFQTINCFFILYYLLEMALKVVAFGRTGYMSYGSNVFDGSLTGLSLVGAVQYYILYVVYYVFAVIGVWSFKGTIIAPASNLRIMTMIVNKTLQCGSYEQLGYWSNNFEGFAMICSGSIYNIMMMNNWSVFLDVYARYNLWSELYFIAWWLTSSVMWVNLFIALILENFIYKWDRNHGCSNRDTVRTVLDTTIQLMFR
uniref:Ion transport domain-containing protein n=1 Tax=Oncorhynchus tshawytscha TaxID=74940 RepID=A0AAZ3QK14_ONCTS